MVPQFEQREKRRTLQSRLSFDQFHDNIVSEDIKAAFICQASRQTWQDLKKKKNDFFKIPSVTNPIKWQPFDINPGVIIWLYTARRRYSDHFLTWLLIGWQHSASQSKDMQENCPKPWGGEAP